MEPDYRPLHDAADHIHFKFADCVDDRNSPFAQALDRQIKEVIQDVQAKKNPRAIEVRIEQIQRQLASAKAQPVSALTPQEADMLWHEYERLRVSLRHMPNYI